MSIIYFFISSMIWITLPLKAEKPTYTGNRLHQNYTCMATCRYDESRTSIPRPRPIDPAVTVTSNYRDSSQEGEVEIDSACQRTCGDFREGDDRITRTNCRISSCACTQHSYYTYWKSNDNYNVNWREVYTTPTHQAVRCGLSTNH